MLAAETQETVFPAISPQAVREQLELLLKDPAFRSSKRSVEFLRYVVEKTLEGSADQIKERTIGVEVFGRDPSYDTNLDHVVRTAAIELRKRLAIYYGQERHRSELRMTMVPGSYIPRFLPPALNTAAPFDKQTEPTAETAVPQENGQRILRKFSPKLLAASLICLLLASVLAYSWMHRATAQDLFWRPVLSAPGSVLLIAGDVPNGPPTLTPSIDPAAAVPLPNATSSPNLPFSDAVTMARVLGTLESQGKNVVIRQQGESSFSELRESPVVLIGAFNNEWSLRLTHRLRFSLALDAEKHLIYIKDAKNPSSRAWSWATDQPTDHQGAVGRPPLQDYALISRIRNSETGQPVIIIGGLYTYGTEAAGEFLADSQMLQAVSREASLNKPHSDVQIVLSTTVTDGTAGPPRVIAVSAE